MGELTDKAVIVTGGSSGIGCAAALPFTRGWDRKIAHVGAEAKKIKHEINTVWIYPPKPLRAAALASADPQRVTDL